ncbi:flagellin [Ciceribacter sp. L1K22]|uniref:flagellin N-terminal helical domain-containing protein n=1 Tax=Ciceribacter sp. L1K22 TaxID=2820275 RepID=UPI001ABDE570|nr:flagellin [Ciceribacter sp. L1K22]MBO3760280.1 flagellin [Ciceribacter sp. L1K22]
MSSVITNIGAMAALKTLRAISSDLEESQARLSAGMRVGTASDNAAYWSIATTMRSDNMGLSTVSDALGLGAAKVDTAYTGMESAVEVVKEIKAKLIAATEDGVDREKIQEELSQLQDQLLSIAQSASFNGENWLQADITAAGGTDTKSVVGSLVRDDSGVRVQRVNYELSSSTVLFDTGGDIGILDAQHAIEGSTVTLQVNVDGVVSAYTVDAFTTEDVIGIAGGAFDGDYANAGGNDYVKIAKDTWVRAVDQSGVTNQEVAYEDGTGALWAVDLTPPAGAITASVVGLTINNSTTAAQFDGLVQMVDDALMLMTSAAAHLGSVGMRIDLQIDFIDELSDSIDRGIGLLVDADMNEESTRLKALQTQQQLAIQSLSIANSSPEVLLQLYR